MLNFKHSFGPSFILPIDRSEEKPFSLFTTIEASSSDEPDVPYHALLSNTEKKNIEKHAGFLYLHCWQDDVLRLRAVLTEKTWIGFDLDDTLHEYRRSSETATNKALEEISKQYDTPILALQDEYSRVLKAKTATTFSDGKTSFDYRRERSASVLAHFSLPQDDHFMIELPGYI